MEEQRLTHVGSDGRASMVDVGGKPTTERRAVAESRVTTSLEVLQLIERGDAPKGAVQAEVRCTGQTGVEMEALTAASVAALTVYDMIKALDRAAVIGPTQLREKSGGASGTWRRDG
jgi:cyclic pyranopterin phosphate synthase